MFFYTSLFVVSLFMAFVILWLYRSLVGIGRVVCRAILPGSKENVLPDTKDEKLVTTLKNVPTPWGWRRKSAFQYFAKAKKADSEVIDLSGNAIPWGWKGNKHQVAEYKVKEGMWLIPVAATTRFLNGNKPATAEGVDRHPEWPDRVDEFDFGGAHYRVTRKVKPKKSNLKKITKPWGW